MKKEYLQQLFQTEHILKQTETVTVEVVRNTQTGDLCVKKTLSDRSLGKIYQVLKNIEHIHIVNVIDVFDLETSLVVIEEYIQGQTLIERLVAAVEENTVIYWIKQISNALEFLHNQSPPIIHRDLKPSNIMLQRGQIVLIDFDIARSIKPDVSRDTRFIGTSGYAPPEQYGFAQTDTRSDIYALGVLFRECLQGKTTKWEPVIKKCTAIDPANRYQTVGEVVIAIKGKERHINKFTPFIAVAIIMMVAGTIIFSYRSPMSDSTQKNVVAPVESNVSESNVAISQPTTTDFTTVNYNGNSQDAINNKNERLSNSEQLSSTRGKVETKSRLIISREPVDVEELDRNNFLKARVEFLNIHEVIYPQFEEFRNIDIEVVNIIKDVKAKATSPEKGYIRVINLMRRLRFMSSVVPSNFDFVGITSRWSRMLDSYHDTLERYSDSIAEGRCDKIEAVLADQATKRNEQFVSMMSDYAKLQQKFNVP